MVKTNFISTLSTENYFCGYHLVHFYFQDREILCNFHLSTLIDMKIVLLLFFLQNIDIGHIV